MELALLVYLMGVLSALNKVLLIVITISSVAVFIFSMIADIDKKDSAWKHAKNSFIVFLASLTLTVVLPSERTGYIMIGAYTAQKIATDERTSAIGNKVYNIIDAKLQEFIDKADKK